MIMKPTVYVETTIPSFYFSQRDDPVGHYVRETTRHWWDEHSAGFMMVTSGFTLRELAAAPPALRSPAEGLLLSVPLLPLPDRLEEVVETYLAHQLVPKQADGDAAHLAMASLYACEYLLTWNCRHLANARKTRHIIAVNQLLGLASPLIVTPETLMEDLP